MAETCGTFWGFHHGASSMQNLKSPSRDQWHGESSQGGQCFQGIHDYQLFYSCVGGQFHMGNTTHQLKTNDVFFVVLVRLQGGVL